MAEYGFSIPKDLGTDEHFCSDSDLAVTVAGGSLYLVYKLKGEHNLYATKGSRSGITKEMNWSAAVDTGQVTDSFPAVTYFNGDIYMLWKESGGNEIYYGKMNPVSLKVTKSGALPEARSKQGVAASVSNNRLCVLHIGTTVGIAGRSIYQISFDGSKWSSDDKIQSGQSSKDAPVMDVNGSVLYLAHRGKTDGIAGNTIYWSENSSGEYDSWSDNKPAEKPSEKAESQHRPGGGIWNNSFVVVHNGNTSEKLRLVYMDLDELEWYGDNHIGQEFKSHKSAAFAVLDDEAFLMFVDTDSAGTLKWSKSQSIHT